MMNGRNIRKFPCTYRSGRLMTLDECHRCRKSERCDIYATVLDELGEEEDDDAKVDE